MFAKLTALVAGSQTLPYNLHEPYATNWGVWTHHSATHKDDNSNVSIFRVAASDPQDSKLVIARNGVKRLRTLRHPNVLAFKDSMELVEKGLTVLYLVTEPVKPLKDVLDDLDLQPPQKDEYLAMGLLHITKAISFLNNDCKMIHGNICMDAVVVTETLDWKLHGFELLSEHTLPGDFGLTSHQWMVANQYKPAELGKNEWDVIRRSPAWSVDAWGLGCLMQEVFSAEPLTQIEKLRRISIIPKALLGDYQKLLSSAPARRLDPSKVAESTFLNNRLVDTVKFMENIALKDEVDKEAFFRKLPGTLPAFPARVTVGKVLPLLTNALEFGGAPAVAVSSVLLIGKSLETEDFNRRVVPCLSKLFASPDRTVRRNLLESLDQYGQHLTQPVVEEQIYPHLQTGFSDNVPYIRELTLKSILVLAPKLSNKTMTQSVLKHMSKLQVDEEASIRANTTVLLGNIAPHLGEATCKRVLLNAFTRALKDLFPPARIAALRAMVATMQYYSTEDIATRVLPTIAPLAVDTVAEVRQSTLQCLAALLKVLEDYDLQQRGEGTPAAGSAPAAPVDASAMSGASSMLNWAVSSLISTGAKPKPASPVATPSSQPSTQQPHTGAFSRNASNSSLNSFASASSHHRVGSTPSSPPGSASPSRPFSAVAGTTKPAATDGWDDDDFTIDDEEIAARSRLGARTAPTAAAKRSSGGGSSAAASSRLTSSTAAAPAASKAADGWDMDGDMDKWDDLDSSPAPTPAPAPARAAVAQQPGPSAAGPRARPARPAREGAGAAAPKKLGGMKLGAQKLGVQKLPASSLMDNEEW